MAGSLSHIVRKDGTFTMSCIDSLGDAGEALEECHRLIAVLIAGPDARQRLEAACESAGAVTPDTLPVFTPDDESDWFDDDDEDHDR